MVTRTAYDSQLEPEVLEAEPVERVIILYRAAIEAIGSARRAVAEGNIEARVRSVNKASAILIELSTSLHRESGGDIARNLTELYDYMQRRLMEANFRQSDQPLAETAKLLSTLIDGWVEAGAVH